MSEAIKKNCQSFFPPLGISKHLQLGKLHQRLMSFLSHSWKQFLAEQLGSSSEHGGHMLLVITVNFCVTVSPAWLHNMIERPNKMKAYCACHV